MTPKKTVSSFDLTSFPILNCCRQPILFVDQPDASDAPDGSDGAFSE